MRSKYKQERSGDHGMLYITLKSYLGKLTAEQRTLPEDQRKLVPTLDELAESVGVSSATLSNLVNGKQKFLNLDIGAHIITELRRRGFDTDISDIMSYRPPQKE